MSVFCLSTMISATSFADEGTDSKTGLNISLICDDGINLKTGDTFQITARNSHTGENTEIEVDVSEIEEDKKAISLEPGVYLVQDVNYKGNNSEFKDVKYAIPLYFNSNADYDYFYIAVGESAVDRLHHDYLDVMIKTAEEAEVTSDNNIGDNRVEENMVNVGNGIVPEEEIENGNYELPGHDSEKDNSQEKQESKKVGTDHNYVLGLIPILGIGVIGGITLYVLKKKKKL